MTVQINTADPRVKRTRHLLQQSLMELAQEKSFREITVQDIADRATVNRATFYAHYEDKYALMDACIRELFHQRLAERLAPHAAWSLDNLHQLVMTVFTFLSHMHHECTPADREFDPYIQSTIQEEIAVVLLVWFRLPSFHDLPRGVAAETLATIWGCAIYGAATQWSHGTRTVSADEMARQIVTVLTPRPV